MGLASGTNLGPYEVLALLGAGGMGEVYRARDTRLGREVALKILPNALAADGERMARFRREAQVLASLNHPNVATMHGAERHRRDEKVGKTSCPSAPIGHHPRLYTRLNILTHGSL